jgi:hypothetical protein
MQAPAREGLGDEIDGVEVVVVCQQ